VHLQEHELLLGHGVQVAAEAVEHDHSGAVRLDGPADHAGQLARAKFGRIDLLEFEQAGLYVRPEVEVQAGGPLQENFLRFVEIEEGHLLAAPERGHDDLHGQGRFAGA
jgi:hypothetical protein